MARTTAAQWLQRWGSGLNNAGQRIKEGVAKVTVAPGQAAAAKVQKMRNGVLQAIDSGKWANNVSAVPLSTWQQAMSVKGTANIASGVTQAQQTKQGKIQQMLDDNDAALAAIASMPSDTPDQRIQRAVAFMQARKQIAAQRGA